MLNGNGYSVGRMSEEDIEVSPKKSLVRWGNIVFTALLTLYLTALMTIFITLPFVRWLKEMK